MHKEKDNLIHIKCPKCGWQFACQDTKTGLVMCAYCQYRNIFKMLFKGGFINDENIL